MSRVFDALKRAQMESSSQTASAEIERREDERRSIQLRVFVYGYSAHHEPFHEEVTTISVSATGALLVLRTPVKLGEKLLLTNPANLREQQCKVVHLGERTKVHAEVGVAFSKPCASFWAPLRP
ncbi:MAG: PilZ domain-containing protein [Bryobacteraceae bacterium]